MSLPVVGFAGMTHLGLVSATAVTARGMPTVCYDPDQALVARLRNRELPVVEPDLDDMVAANGDRQTFTADLADLSACGVVYIAKDVPTDDTGKSDTSGIAALIEQILPILGEKAVLVILCQVPPGFTRKIPLEPSRLYYQVETLIFGRAVERATQPERYIVGCAAPDAPLHPAFEAVLAAFGCPILSMRYESAELAKISINMCLVASVSVANTMAEICEKIGAVWSEIVPALKLDRRIGQYSYLSPGLGIAGGNLERDLATVLRFSEEYGTDSGVVSAWIANSRHRRDWALRLVHESALREKVDPVLAVWGLAYKENTHSTKNSPSLATIAPLAPYRLRVFDPVIPVAAANHPRAEGATSPVEAASGADALLILTPWPVFRQADPAAVAKVMAGRLVIDPYAVLDHQAATTAGLDHRVLGAPAAV